MTTLDVSSDNLAKSMEPVPVRQRFTKKTAGRKCSRPGHVAVASGDGRFAAGIAVTGRSGSGCPGCVADDSGGDDERVPPVRTPRPRPRLGREAIGGCRATPPFACARSWLVHVILPLHAIPSKTRRESPAEVSGVPRSALAPGSWRVFFLGMRVDHSRSLGAEAVSLSRD